MKIVTKRFYKIKRPLKGKRFEDEFEMHTEANTIIDDLNKEEAFNWISRLPKIWQNVIDNDGAYVI